MKIRGFMMILVGGGLLLVSGSVLGQAPDGVEVASVQLSTADSSSLPARILLTQPHLGPVERPLPDFAALADVSLRKERFFDYLLPLVQAENEGLSEIRRRLGYLRDLYRWERNIDRRDHDWLALVISTYLLPAGDPHSPGFWTTVFERVDGLPTDLVLAQAANESAWGTSRFAREGNNLFGQWCFRPGCGIVPAGRAAGAQHEVAHFETVSQSVGSYMHNLNTGPSYQHFREIRARIREQGSEPGAAELVAGLANYSARGLEYVDELRAMIRHNADIIDKLRQPGSSDGNG